MYLRTGTAQIYVQRDKKLSITDYNDNCTTYVVWVEVYSLLQSVNYAAMNCGYLYQFINEVKCNVILAGLLKNEAIYMPKHYVMMKIIAGMRYWLMSWYDDWKIQFKLLDCWKNGTTKLPKCNASHTSTDNVSNAAIYPSGNCW